MLCFLTRRNVQKKEDTYNLGWLTNIPFFIFYQAKSLGAILLIWCKLCWLQIERRYFCLYWGFQDDRKEVIISKKFQCWAVVCPAPRWEYKRLIAIPGPGAFMSFDFNPKGYCAWTQCSKNLRANYPDTFRWQGRTSYSQFYDVALRLVYFSIAADAWIVRRMFRAALCLLLASVTQCWKDKWGSGSSRIYRLGFFVLPGSLYTFHLWPGSLTNAWSTALPYSSVLNVLTIHPPRTSCLSLLILSPTVLKISHIAIRPPFLPDI